MDERPTYDELEWTLAVVRRKIAVQQAEIDRLNSVIDEMTRKRDGVRREAMEEVVSSMLWRLLYHLHDDFRIEASEVLP